MLADDQRLIVPAEPENCDMSWFVFVVRLADNFTRGHRDHILKTMAEKNIIVRDYFTPVLQQPFIVRRLSPNTADFPITDSVCQRTLALPFHNNLTKNEAALVCNHLKAALDQITN
jgi:perosamine synthetase